MALISSSGFAHVRLTVTDIAVSKAFYDEVFGWPVAVDNSDRVAEPGVTESQEAFYGGTVYQTPSGSSGCARSRRKVSRSTPSTLDWITSVSR